MSVIVESDEVLGGKARIKGSRVSVEQISEMYSKRGMSVSDISEALPTVDEDEVAAAIEFVRDKEKSSGDIVA